MNNIFEQFQGADLDRLAECVKAIRLAGLTIGKHTDAGVNQGSGNVWVWSEDWPGCVYCSIGFDVAWCYSCPECGEEHDFDTFEEMEEYASRYEGCCKACKPKFVAGWNMPGYLPDSEPAEFDSAEDALEYIKDEMWRESDNTEDTDEAIELQSCVKTMSADKNGEFGQTIGKYHYFVTLEA